MCLFDSGQTHNEVRVKYLTSVMFAHARAQDVVKEMPGVLDKLFSLGIDGPIVNKSKIHKVKQVKKKVINHWSSAQPAA